MNNFSWIGFGYSNTLTKTVLHFLPSSSTTQAPYPVVYDLAIYNKEIGYKNISIEDGRLGQPDGVRIEDVFPVISEIKSGYYALRVEYRCLQPKVVIDDSTCIVEIINSGNSIKYFATPTAASTVVSNVNNDFRAPLGNHSISIPVIEDAYCQTSLMIINDSKSKIKLNFPDLKNENIRLSSFSYNNNTATEYNQLAGKSNQNQIILKNKKESEDITLQQSVISSNIFQVDTNCCQEYDINLDKLNRQDDVEAINCAWGIFRGCALRGEIRIQSIGSDNGEKNDSADSNNEQIINSDIKQFVIYKDTKSKRVISIIGLN